MRINVVGNIFGIDGYSNHTRSLVNGLYELNSDIKLDVPLPPNWNMLVNDAELNMITSKPKIPDATIAIMTPPFWRIALGDKTKKFIGFLVWEGNKIPEYWIEYLLDERVDQIWVPSQHTQQAILNTIDAHQALTIVQKIRVVPHGVDLNIFQPQETKKDDKFTFLCNKGWRGGMEDRGGVGYVLKAFCDEFNKDDDVRLLLKLNPSYINPQAIKLELDKLQLSTNRPEIQINCDNLAQKDLPILYSKGDVYVCAQRADAFNLCGLEAMGCGLATIQTKFGGQTDYMNKDNSWFIDYTLEPVKDVVYEEVQWGIPNVTDLRKSLREAFTQRDTTREKGKQALNDAKDWTWRISAKKALKFLKELK